MCSCSQGREVYLIPVLPNPPEPRFVTDSSLTSSNFARATGTNASCAILSPNLSVNGSRGEAEAGYPSVRITGLPALRGYVSRGMCMNDALCMTLVHIMTHAHDTNIISRHDVKTADEVMTVAGGMIESGFGIEDILRLDGEFIGRWISPGGSGDLLAVTYFMYLLDFEGCFC